MKRGLIVFILIFTSLAGISLVSALTSDLQMNSTYGEDSYIVQDKSSNNYGTSTVLESDSESGRNERILLFFNLSSLPSSSIIYNATLQIYLSSATGSNFNLTTGRLVKEWTEAGVTWNTGNGTDSWAVAGGDYASDDYGYTAINSTLGWKTFDLATIVQEWVNRSYPNYGLIFVPQSQAGNNLKQFASRENANLSLVPRLTINYIYDLIPPAFSSFSATPANGSAYTPVNFYQFNVTIEEQNPAEVWIEWDGVNYTSEIANISDVYIFNRTDLAAGIYAYQWWANDSFGNINNSGVRYHTIIKSDNNLTLLSSVGWGAVDYGTESTFSCSALYSIPDLYISNIEVANPATSVLAVGSHNIKCNISESQNYSSGAAQGTITVNKINSQVSLEFDKTSPQNYGDSITPTCSIISGAGSVNLSLNGVQIDSGQALTLGAGTWNFNCSYAGNQNYSASSEQFDYIINKALGEIRLFLNGQENNFTIDYPQEYNITAFTLYGAVSVYKNGEEVTVSNGLNATPLKTANKYNITAVSSGDENHSSTAITRWLNVTLDAVLPEVSVDSPQEGGSYGYDTNLNLNFSVSDEHLDSCWYNLDGTENITLINCENSTFNAGGDGYHTVYLYANDTIGNIAVKNSTFYVLVGAPTIILNSPIGIYLNSNEVTFRYTPSDIDLGSCELWGDFNGEFKLNQTDFSPESDAENIFSLHLPDRTYKWNIKCNDSSGNSVFNGNKTFYVDRTPPSVLISEPVGLKTSRTEIPIQFSVIDASPAICWFNLRYTTGQEVLGNTSIPGCSSTSFGVSTDGDYILSIFAKDFANNFNSSSSSFSVDTSAPASPPSGNSGGGVGGSVSGTTTNFTLNKGELELSKISSLIVSNGESKKIVLGVKNTGKSFLNDCRLKGAGKNSGWIASEGVKGLSAGEKTDFIFTLNVPAGLEAGAYDVEIKVSCQESNASTKFTAEIIKRKIGVDLVNVERAGNNKLRVIYSLAELSGFNQRARVEIILFGFENERLAEFAENRSIAASSTNQFEATLDVSDDLSGTFNLLINTATETSSAFVQEEIVLGASAIGGFAILRGANADTIFSSILVALFIIFSVFILRRILKFRHLGKGTSLIKDIKGRFPEISKSPEKEEEYLGVPFAKEKNSKVLVKPMTLGKLEGINGVLNEIREGNIVVLDIGELKSEPEKIRKAVNAIKKTANAVGGSIAGFGRETVIIMPKFAEIYKRKEEFEAENKREIP